MSQHATPSHQELFLGLDHLSPDILNGMSATQLDLIREELNELLRHVHLARNAKIVVNTVIKDVIYRIFTICVNSYKDPVRQALSLSHVCHHWRQLTLQWPALWTAIDLRFSNLSKLCLQRNAMAPIDLVISDGFKSGFMSRFYTVTEWRRQHSLIPELIPRLRSLTLHIDNPGHSEHVLRYFCDTSPVELRELDIYLPRLDKGPVMLPECFTNAAQPLRSLVLHRVDLNWENLTVRGLTRLCLRAPTVTPTLRQLMNILVTCTDLEEFEMKWIFPPLYPADDHNAPLENTNIGSFLEFEGPVVELPHLRKLLLALATAICLPFFKRLVNYVHVPALRSLVIDSPYHYDAAVTAAALFELFPNNPRYPFEALKHIHINKKREPIGPCILKGRRARDGYSMGLLDESNMDIFVRTPVPNAPDSTVSEPTEATVAEPTAAESTNFQSLLCFLNSMHAVEHLELYVDAWSYLRADSGIDFFTAMPKLLTLEISGEQSSALATETTEVWDRVTSHQCNSLTTLCLRHLRCENERLMELVAATRIRNIQLDHCSGVDAHGIAALREFGVLVYSSEEMSEDEMVSLWGESWSSAFQWSGRY